MIMVALVLVSVVFDVVIGVSGGVGKVAVVDVVVDGDGIYHGGCNVVGVYDVCVRCGVVMAGVVWVLVMSVVVIGVGVLTGYWRVACCCCCCCCRCCCCH